MEFNIFCSSSPLQVHPQTINFMEQTPSWETNGCPASQKCFAFMKPKRCSTCSQESAADPILSQMNPIHAPPHTQDRHQMGSEEWAFSKSKILATLIKWYKHIHPSTPCSKGSKRTETNHVLMHHTLKHKNTFSHLESFSAFLQLMRGTLLTKQTWINDDFAVTG
jgi:hypothetical protein